MISARRPALATGLPPILKVILAWCRDRFLSGSSAALPKPATAADRDLLLKIGALALQGTLSEESLESSLEAIRRHQTPIHNRFAFFGTVLADRLSKDGGNLHQLLASVPTPPPPSSQPAAKAAR